MQSILAVAVAVALLQSTSAVPIVERSLPSDLGNTATPWGSNSVRFPGIPSTGLSGTSATGFPGTGTGTGAGFPSQFPSFGGAGFPSQFPSFGGAGFPSQFPSFGGAGFPSQFPSFGGAGFPSQFPSSGGAGFPSQFPSIGGGGFPSQFPSSGGSGFPSQFPSFGGAGFPSQFPSFGGAGFPSQLPSLGGAGSGFPGSNGQYTWNNQNEVRKQQADSGTSTTPYGTTNYNRQSLSDSQSSNSGTILLKKDADKKKSDA